MTTDPHAVSPEIVLAQVIASHFTGSLVEEAGRPQVHLGEGLPTITCIINSMQERAPHGVFVTLEIAGGDLGPVGATVTASGYGESTHQALVEAGCLWACSFGPVLLTGLGRPDLIATHNPQVDSFEYLIAGRRFRVVSSHLDRSAGVPVAEAGALRTELGGESALTKMVINSVTLPELRCQNVIPLGSFLGLGAQRSAEVKLGAHDWAPSLATWSGLTPREPGYRMLREWALLVPLEPPPPLERGRLQHSLNLLRAAGEGIVEAEAGWRGGRQHGMQLGPVAKASQIAALEPLTEQARWFFGTIALTGAGPGYGLAPERASARWLKLAEAGCGAEWYLDCQGGQVWLNAMACDDSFTVVAPDMVTWYEQWLNNAVLGGGVFAKWNVAADAAIKALGMTIDEYGPDQVSQHWQQLTLTNSQGRTIGPCHACQTIFARYGLGDDSFAPN